MTVRVGVNGFGRIGRNFWRAVDSLDHDIEIVAVNDLTDNKTLAHLLKYDSIMGKLPYEVTASDGVDHRRRQGDQGAVRARSRRAAVERPGRRRRHRVHGLLHQGGRGGKHLSAGAKKVIISAPATDEDLTVVVGVNDDKYDGSQNILSNASCTTNCVAPMAKVLHENFGSSRA